jgi:PST family polysaccharide transporter
MPSIQVTAVRGASWTIAAGTVTRVLGLVGSVMVTHYVSPADLGDAGAAAIFVATAQTITTLGLGQYLVTTKDRERANTFHVTVVNYAAVAIAVAVAFAIRVPLATFLKVAASARYLPWLLVGFVIDRTFFIPERLLLRQLQFRRVAVARSAGDFVYVVVTLTLAVLGWGAWSLIAGNVARSVLKAAALMTGVRMADWLAPCPLDRAIYRRIFDYGVPTALQGILGTISSKWDNLAFSYLFGDAAMGKYNSAYNLADVPADQIGESIAEVLLPSLASMSPEERDRTVVEVTGLTALLIFPLSIGLGAVAKTLIATILSPEWQQVGPMLAILAALSVVRPLAWQANAYFMTIGTTRIGLMVDTVKLVLLFTILFTLARFGQLWACVAVGVAFGIALLLAWWIIARRINRSVFDFVAECLPALAACGVMTAAVLATRWAFAQTGIQVRGVGLALEVVAGAIGYLAALPVVARKSATKLLGLIQEARRSRSRKA